MLAIFPATSVGVAVGGHRGILGRLSLFSFSRLLLIKATVRVFLAYNFASLLRLVYAAVLRMELTVTVTKSSKAYGSI